MIYAPGDLVKSSYGGSNEGVENIFVYTATRTTATGVQTDITTDIPLTLGNTGNPVIDVSYTLSSGYAVGDTIEVWVIGTLSVSGDQPPLPLHPPFVLTYLRSLGDAYDPTAQLLNLDLTGVVIGASPAGNAITGAGAWVRDQSGNALATASAIAAAVWAVATSTLTTASTIGKRLMDFVGATSTYSAAPTAQANANALLDTALSGHQTAGTAGKALSDASAGGGPGPNFTVKVS